jgi:hypothetical protein
MSKFLKVFMRCRVVGILVGVAQPSLFEVGFANGGIVG